MADLLAFVRAAGIFVLVTSVIGIVLDQVRG